jgi:hypothetical protein
MQTNSPTLIPHLHPGTLQKSIAWSMRKTCSDIARTASFSELAAIVIARRFDSTGRKKDARNILTSYLRLHRTSNNVLRALDGYYL